MASGVLDGQPVSAAITNAAFLAKNGDDTATGKINLGNSDPASGPPLSNAQRELNSLISYIGKAAGQAFDAKPTWSDASAGTPLDTLSARAEALTAKFNPTTGHKHDGVDSTKIPATNLGSVGATTGQVPVADGSGGVVWGTGVGTHDHDGTNSQKVKATNLDPTGATTGQVLKYDGTNVVWGQGSGEGGINYVSANGGNADFEVGVAGWSKYANGAAKPTTLTGGSPTLTLTRTTTNPIRGTGSGLITPGALGDGVAYTITPDRADVKNGSVQTISLEYEPSGTIATGDYQLWVYDVANSQLIQPAGYTIPGGVAGQVYKHRATFQLPTSGTTFRVAIHQAVASPGGSLKVDSVSVGPQQTTLGAIVTDWQSFTPTGSWSANTTYTGRWRRVGDTAQVQIGLTLSGAPTSAALTLNLPSGLTIDTNKIPDATGNNATLGKLVGYVGTGSSFDGYVKYNSTTNVGMVWFTTGGTPSTSVINSNVTQASPGTFASGGLINAEFEVPIAGWGSSMVLSSSSDEGRPVAVNAALSGTQSVGNGSEPAVVWTSISKDTHAMVNTLTGEITAKVPGYYHWEGALGYAGNATGVRAASFKINGAGQKYMAQLPNSGASVISVIPFSGGAWLEAGQVLTIHPYQDSGSSLNLNTLCHIAIHRLSGNQTIAASESVNARYKTAAGQSLSSGGAGSVVDFGARDYDSNVRVTTGAAWRFVAESSGKFDVQSTVTFAANGTGARELMLFKNGALFASLDYKNGTSVIATLLRGGTEVPLLAGEYIDIRAYQNSGGSLALQADAAYNYVTIKRVGNY